MPKKEIDSNQPDFVFGKSNYKWMIIGLLFIIIGYVCMAGGGSEDPTHFDPEIYNTTRIRVAPTLIIIGLGIQIYAILTKAKD